MPQLNVRVDDDLIEWFEIEARRLKVSVSQVVKKALIEYQTRKERVHFISKMTPKEKKEFIKFMKEHQPHYTVVQK